MEHLAIISHNSFRSIGFHKSRSPSSPYGPAPQGSQLITLTFVELFSAIYATFFVYNILIKTRVV